MSDHNFAQSLKQVRQFFNTSTKCFDEDDAGFAPKPGMFTVAQHIAHSAQVIPWFIEGAFSPAGMSTDFEAMEKITRSVATLKEARASMDHACADAIAFIEKKSMSDFMQPIAGHIMAGAPRVATFTAIADH